MARIAGSYGVAFDRDNRVHGGRHDKFFVGSCCVEVPRHNEIVEYTARGILRTFDQMCAEAAKEER
jgi:hypothetical protein